jgi:hypothetical protein
MLPEPALRGGIASHGSIANRQIAGRQSFRLALAYGSPTLANDPGAPYRSTHSCLEDKAGVTISLQLHIKQDCEYLARGSGRPTGRLQAT